MGPTGAGGTYDRMKFRSQTSSIWTDGKAEVEGVRQQKARRKKIREEKGRRKKIKIKVREKVENVLF
jgi:maltose-binding protein MalE